MSADNWDVCPRCLAAAREDLADKRQRVDAGYGVLPVDEWDALRAEVAAGIDEESLRTFREDYEIYGAEEGTITVVYSGHCQKCDCGLKFRDERPFYPEVER